MLKVVIIGYGEMFSNLIAGVLDANCEIVGVLRREMTLYNPVVRWFKDTFNPSQEYNYIKSYNLPEICVRSVNTEEFKKALLKLNPDIILVGSWGEKIKKEIFDIPKIATINAHPSLLPKYRGANPYFWVIKNREKTTGITFHLMDEKIDTGAILAQEEIKIYPSDTGKSLKERTVLAARGVVCELLKDLSEDIIIPLTQIENKSTYFPRPNELELDFSKSAEENEALIRASYPWCMSYFFHKDSCFTAKHEGMEITGNHTEYTMPGTIVDINTQKRTIQVLCADNKILKFQIEYFRKYDRPFTSNYMKHEMYIGEVLD